MSDDLVTFLRARYDEDAALAAEATQDTTGRWTASETDWGGGPFVEDDCGALILPTPASRVATQYQHIARHDPARVLAEVDAKRAILDELDHVVQGQPLYVDVLLFVAREMGTVYSAHPDYKESWRP